MMNYLVNPVAQYVVYWGLGLLSGYVLWRLPLDRRRRSVSRARRDRREADRILEMTRVPARTMLQIAIGQEPGRHRVRSPGFDPTPAEVKASLFDRLRETMEGLKEAWHGLFHGPVRTPEGVAETAFIRERGPGGLREDETLVSPRVLP